MDDARIIGSPDPSQKYLASQSRHSLMIEVGPVPNGAINGKVLEGTVSLLDTILFHLNSLPTTLSGEVDLYIETQDVKYPVDEKNEIKAYIHSSFQDKDFVAMKGKITPFRSLSGEDIGMDLNQEMYPIFINEVAYYPQHLAFTLCRKTKMKF
jgi:aspartoacylase